MFGWYGFWFSFFLLSKCRGLSGNLKSCWREDGDRGRWADTSLDPFRVMFFLFCAFSSKARGQDCEVDVKTVKMEEQLSPQKLILFD